MPSAMMAGRPWPRANSSLLWMLGGAMWKTPSLRMTVSCASQYQRIRSRVMRRPGARSSAPAAIVALISRGLRLGAIGEHGGVLVGDDDFAGFRRAQRHLHLHVFPLAPHEAPQHAALGG